MGRWSSGDGPGLQNPLPGERVTRGRVGGKCGLLGKEFAGGGSQSILSLPLAPRLTRLHHALTLLTLGSHLGEDLLWAWRRGRREGGKRLWAGGCSLPCCLPLPLPSLSTQTHLSHQGTSWGVCPAQEGPPPQRPAPTTPNAPELQGWLPAAPSYE